MLHNIYKNIWYNYSLCFLIFPFAHTFNFIFGQNEASIYIFDKKNTYREMIYVALSKI